MLTARYANKLPELLLPQADFHPFPTAAERAPWEALSPDLRGLIVKRGEELLGYQWPSATAADYMDFARTGDRSRYETAFNLRRRALVGLVLAECVEGRGRFLDDIINGAVGHLRGELLGIPAHNFPPGPATMPCPTPPIPS